MMRHLQLVLAIISLCTLHACTDEYLDETDPVIVTTELNGNIDYFMKGTFDGEPFELRHLTKSERNAPHFNTIGTEFVKTNFTADHPTPSDHDWSIILAITQPDPSSFGLEDVITLGQFDFYHEAILPSNTYEWFLRSHLGQNLLINKVYHARAIDPLFDKIEITEINLVDTSIDPNYTDYNYTSLGLYGPLYNVKGNFQVKLITPADEVVELIIEEFSGMFQSKY